MSHWLSLETMSTHGGMSLKAYMTHYHCRSDCSYTKIEVILAGVLFVVCLMIELSQLMNLGYQRSKWHHKYSFLLYLLIASNTWLHGVKFDKCIYYHSVQTSICHILFYWGKLRLNEKFYSCSLFFCMSIGSRFHNFFYNLNIKMTESFLSTCPVD